MARTGRVEIRVTDAEKAAWAEAAGGSRRVSEWLRRLANERAFGGVAELADAPASSTGDLGREGSIPSPATEPLLDDPVVEATKIALLDEGTHPREQKSGKLTGQCPRWPHHRKGTYCGTCKKIN
jgi:hypothetical protein